MSTAKTKRPNEKDDQYERRIRDLPQYTLNIAILEAELADLAKQEELKKEEEAQIHGSTQSERQVSRGNLVEVHQTNGTRGP